MSRACVALTAALLALAACRKIDYLPADPVEPWPTRVLMHRGGGAGGPFPDNTLPAVRYGASILDGVEVDVQVSANGTLWLGHDNEAHGCDGQIVGCFQDLSDAQLDGIAYCPGDPGSEAVQIYVRLEEVLAAMAIEHPDGLYSLDIKGQYCRSIGRDQARVMADQVDRLVRTYGLQGKVAIETEQPAFLERLDEVNSTVFSFVYALDDIDTPLWQASRYGATGISFKYGAEPLDADVVAGIHRAGKRIVVFTIDDPADIAAVWASRVDVVETDNPDFMSYVAP